MKQVDLSANKIWAKEKGIETGWTRMEDWHEIWHLHWVGKSSHFLSRPLKPFKPYLARLIVSSNYSHIYF